MQESGSQLVISVLLIPDGERSFPPKIDIDRAAESQPGSVSPHSWTAKGAWMTPSDGMCSSEAEGDEPSLVGLLCVSTVCVRLYDTENSPELLTRALLPR